MSFLTDTPDTDIDAVPSVSFTGLIDLLDDLLGVSDFGNPEPQMQDLLATVANPYGWTQDQRLVVWFCSVMDDMFVADQITGVETKIALTSDLIQDIRENIHPIVKAMRLTVGQQFLVNDPTYLDQMLDSADMVADGTDQFAGVYFKPDFSGLTDDLDTKLGGLEDEFTAAVTNFVERNQGQIVHTESIATGLNSPMVFA